MFIGEFQHNLDSKGRLAVPVKFRQKLTAGAIITRGLDKCLFVFGSKEWEILAQKLIALPLAQANSRAFVRLMLAGATDVVSDATLYDLVDHERLKKFQSHFLRQTTLVQIQFRTGHDH